MLVKGNRIISAGYNGTPEGVENCLDGGCVRCAKKEQFAPSMGYDVCICVHAEENALITAARFGISVEGATAYSTMRPCFTCTRALFQAKVRGIFYLHDWRHPEAALNEQYALLQARFPDRVKRVHMTDRRAKWANSGTKLKVAVPEEPVKAKQPATEQPLGIEEFLNTRLN